MFWYISSLEELFYLNKLINYVISFYSTWELLEGLFFYIMYAYGVILTRLCLIPDHELIW